MTVIGFLSRVALVAVGVYTIKKLVCIPAAKTPTQSTVEHFLILGLSVGTYGLEEVSALAGLTVAEMAVLSILVLATVKFSRAWYREHNLGASHGYQTPPETTAGGYGQQLFATYAKGCW